MRTIVHISLLAGIVFLASCSDTEIPTTTEIVVIVDKTDSLLSQPDSEEIISRFGLETNKSNGADFRLVVISDVSYNRIKTAHLEPVNDKWSSNDLKRDRAIQEFEETVREIIARVAQEEIGREYSSIYAPLATELNRPDTTTSNERVVLVYSDLMEHQKKMSFYDKGTFDLIKNDPEKIKARLDSQVPLADLSGVTIYFLYQPANAEQDNQYSTVSGFYKNLFEEKGPTVIIGANLTD